METNNNITIIFDGHYFINSRLHAIPFEKSEQGMIMDDKESQHQFLRKLVNDFAYEYRNFAKITDQVIFCLDSKSWRYDYLEKYNKDNENTQVLYKNNRKEKKKEINWDKVSNVLEEFKNILKASGVIVNHIEGTEGDDMIWWWVSNLSYNSKSCLIWSRDHDLYQLINWNPSTESYVICYDSISQKLVTYPGFEKWIYHHEQEDNIVDLHDIFSYDPTILTKSKVKDFWKEFHKTNKIEQVFCDDFMFIKILTGDKSDNIDSVYSWWSKNGSKVYNVTEKKASEILTTFKSKNSKFSIEYFFNDAIKSEIVEIVLNKYDLDSSKREVLFERLERNIKLMLLHNKTIPDYIVKKIDETNTNLNERKIKRNYLRSYDSMIELVENENANWLNDFKGTKEDETRGIF